MIKIVNAPTLAFEKIVAEELNQHFARHGFRCLGAPLLKYKNQDVTFERRREGQMEEIVLQRAIYDREQWQGFEDEVEMYTIPYDKDYLWVSRHRVCVHFIVDGATNWLQRDGRAGTGEDYWWYFTDEADLRRLLRELSPVILAAGQATFDARLEDYREGYVTRPAA